MQFKLENNEHLLPSLDSCLGPEDHEVDGLIIQVLDHGRHAQVAPVVDYQVVHLAEREYVQLFFVIINYFGLQAMLQKKLHPALQAETR